jgi:hypothetical protein
MTVESALPTTTGGEARGGRGHHAALIQPHRRWVVRPALPCSHRGDWLTHILSTRAISTVLPRWGARPALQSAAACEGQGQLSQRPQGIKGKGAEGFPTCPGHLTEGELQGQLSCAHTLSAGSAMPLTLEPGDWQGLLSHSHDPWGQLSWLLRLAKGEGITSVPVPPHCIRVVELSPSGPAGLRHLHYLGHLGRAIQERCRTVLQASRSRARSPKCFSWQGAVPALQLSWSRGQLAQLPGVRVWMEAFSYGSLLSDDLLVSSWHENIQHNSHGVLVTIALLYSLGSNTILSPIVFFLLRIYLTINRLLCFHMNSWSYFIVLWRV